MGKQASMYCVQKEKCKSGNICHECQKEADWNGKVISEDQLEELNHDDLLKQFETEEVDREEADPRLKSIIGYLKDCAVAVLRSASFKDVTDSKNVSIFNVPENIFELLES